MKEQMEHTTVTSTNGVAPSVAPRSLALSTFGRVLDYTTRRNIEFFDLTSRVEQLVGESGIADGMVLVQSLHSTASVFLNEWQEALLEDFQSLLQQAVPAGTPWRHNDPRHSDCERGNAAAHLRALLLGTSVVLPVRDRRIVRGTWQSIILAELDGPRMRSVALQVLGA